MKKTSILVLLVTYCMQSVAQDGFFVRAQAGGGGTKIKSIASNFNRVRLICDCGYDVGKQVSAPSADVNTEIGYQYNRVRLITGLQIISTRNLEGASFIAFPSGKTYTTPITDAYSGYYHTLVPLSIAFKISLPGRSALYPELGTRLLFISDNDKVYRHSDIKGRLFSAKLNYEYPVSKKLALAAAPAYYAVASPVFYKPGDDNNRLISFNRSFMLQAGFLWRVMDRKPGTKKEPVQNLNK